MQSALTTFVTDRQLGSILSFAAWILIGALVGVIGNKIINKTGHGLVRDVLLSIFGAMFAGFLTNLLGEVAREVWTVTACSSQRSALWCS